MSAYDPPAEGWKQLPRAPLPGGLGVPWARRDASEWRYGLLTTIQHANPNGVLHGGVLMAFADHGLSVLAWEAAERAPCTTIQLNSHFLDAVHPGEFVTLQGNVTRRTGGHVFLRGMVSAVLRDGARDVLAVDGIWRILRPR